MKNETLGSLPILYPHRILLKDMFFVLLLLQKTRFVC